MRNKCQCIKTYYNENGTIAFNINEIYEYTDKKFTNRKYDEGYNVQFSKGEYLFFNKYYIDRISENTFNTFFKTLKDIRKEKLSNLNEK